MGIYIIQTFQHFTCYSKNNLNNQSFRNNTDQAKSLSHFKITVKTGK